jgi:hypothetical protein
MMNKNMAAQLSRSALTKIQKNTKKNKNIRLRNKNTQSFRT